MLAYSKYLYSFLTSYTGWLVAFPFIVLFGLMLGSLGLLLSVYIKQLENFAGTMNFVIFPMFFISSALYPCGDLLIMVLYIYYYIAKLNPFTYGVEMVRAASLGYFYKDGFISMFNMYFCIFISSSKRI